MWEADRKKWEIEKAKAIRKAKDEQLARERAEKNSVLKNKNMELQTVAGIKSTHWAN